MTVVYCKVFVKLCERLQPSNLIVFFQASIESSHLYRQRLMMEIQQRFTLQYFPRFTFQYVIWLDIKPLPSICQQQALAHQPFASSQVMDQGQEQDRAGLVYQDQSTIIDRARGEEGRMQVGGGNIDGGGAVQVASDP